MDVLFMYVSWSNSKRTSRTRQDKNNFFSNKRETFIVQRSFEVVVVVVRTFQMYIRRQKDLFRTSYSGCPTELEEVNWTKLESFFDVLKTNLCPLEIKQHSFIIYQAMYELILWYYLMYPIMTYFFYLYILQIFLCSKKAAFFNCKNTKNVLRKNIY